MDSINICKYQLPSGNLCGQKAYLGIEFCFEHAKNLTRFYIEDIVRYAIAEQLQVRLEDVSDNASIHYDLGADSLDMPELVITLENLLDLDLFYSDEVEQMVDLESIIESVTNILARENMFFTDIHSDISENVNKAISRTKKSSLKLSLILGSDFYHKYFAALNIDVEQVSDFILSSMRGHWPVFHSLLTKYKENYDLDSDEGNTANSQHIEPENLEVHIVFLTNSAIFHIAMVKSKYSLQKILYKNFSLSYEVVNYENNPKKIKEMTITTQIESAAGVTSNKFRIDDNGITRAKRFLRSYYEITNPDRSNEIN